MSLKSNFDFAFEGVKRRGLRSSLTILAIVIGVASVFALISIGQSVQISISEAFEAMGTDKIFIQPGGSMFGMGATTAKLTEHDLEIIEDVNGVEVAGGAMYKVSPVEYRDEIVYTWVMGVPTDEAKVVIEEAQGMSVSDGSYIKEKYDAVVGYLLTEGRVFEKKVTIGKEITIEGQEFKVSGVMSRVGNPQDDASVLIGLEAAKELFGETDELGFIIAQTKAGVDVSVVSEKISDAMRKDRNLKEGEEDFTIQTSEDLIETFGQIFDVIVLILVGVSAISLLVGAVGIMTTMYTSVLERTKTIGVLKAIGARNSDITIMFLIESGILGVVGGAIGVAVGYALAKAAGYVALNYFQVTYLSAPISPWLIVGMLLFSFVLGSLSGTLPALQAAKLKPAEALRYE